MHKLEVAFVQGTSFISKQISNVSKKLCKDFKGDFAPSHVFLVLDDKIIFESSTYKEAGEKLEKDVEVGTRLVTLSDVKHRLTESIIHRCIISEHCDPYLALQYVAKASNYHYSFKSILKFVANGHLRKEKSNKIKDEYICSGLVLDALREKVFDNNKRLRAITSEYEGIDSNSVTPLDLYMSFDKQGYSFKQSKGYVC